MPNHQKVKEVEVNKLMGSSKRKRNISIKRNVVSEVEEFKPTKVQRTCTKKSKKEKEKIAKDAQEDQKSNRSKRKNFVSKASQTSLLSNSYFVKEKNQRSAGESSVYTGKKNTIEKKEKCSNEYRKNSSQYKSKKQGELCIVPKICSENKMDKSNIDSKEQNNTNVQKGNNTDVEKKYNNDVKKGNNTDMKEENDTDIKKEDDTDIKKENDTDSKEQDNTNKKKSASRKKYVCEVCLEIGLPRAYTTIEKHRNHMATVHDIYSDEMKRFQCKDCPTPVWFPTKSKFMYHLGSKHLGVIKFICDVCTETFKLKANYKDHMKTHNLVTKKKFSCDVCNGTFVNKAGYEAHKKRFPGPHIKQSCVHCGFSFSKEKHIKNHRCKTLLLKEAANRGKTQPQELHNPEEDEISLSQSDDIKMGSFADDTDSFTYKQDASIDSDSFQKKLNNSDPQSNKKLIFHRLIPRRETEETIYRPIQLQAQNVSESVIVQELREIDFETGTFITTTTAEHEQQFIVRDVNGQLLQGNQILQFDINDSQHGEESQVNFTECNLVTPYVIKEK